LGQNKVKPALRHAKQDPWASVVEKQAWLVGNKVDLPGALDNWQVIKELYFGRFGLSAVSAEAGDEIARLKQELITALDIIRVYSKRPGHDADFGDPFVLRRGSKVLEFAQLVHKDFAENLKFARMWGHGKYEGQRVNRDYVLDDKDVIELHV
jgi:uncharacterized protein